MKSKKVWECFLIDKLIYKLKDSLFAALFREMEVNRAVYDSNYNYYLKRPAEMEAIFDEVMVNLSERSALLKEKKESETE